MGLQKQSGYFQKEARSKPEALSVRGEEGRTIAGLISNNT